MLDPPGLRGLLRLPPPAPPRCAVPHDPGGGPAHVPCPGRRVRGAARGRLGDPRLGPLRAGRSARARRSTRRWREPVRPPGCPPIARRSSSIAGRSRTCPTTSSGEARRAPERLRPSRRRDRAHDEPTRPCTGARSQSSSAAGDAMPPTISSGSRDLGAARRARGRTPGDPRARRARAGGPAGRVRRDAPWSARSSGRPGRHRLDGPERARRERPRLAAIADGSTTRASACFADGQRAGTADVITATSPAGLGPRRRVCHEAERRRVEEDGVTAFREASSVPRPGPRLRGAAAMARRGRSLRRFDRAVPLRATSWPARRRVVGGRALDPAAAPGGQAIVERAARAGGDGSIGALGYVARARRLDRAPGAARAPSPSARRAARSTSPAAAWGLAEMALRPATPRAVRCA